MSTRTRLTAFQKWVTKNLCEGKSMKTPGETDFSVVYTEPRCFVALYPWTLNEASAYSVAPSILIIPDASKGKDIRGKSYDQSEGVNRPQNLGAQLNLNLIYCVYDPGDRTAELKITQNPYTDILEGNNGGFYTMTDWIDETMEKLLQAQTIPGSDLFLYEDSLTWFPLTEGETILDRRPLYYGVLQVGFGGEAQRRQGKDIKQLLD